MLFCQVNDQQVNALSVNDRGLAYGDGIFTTAKIVNGQVEMLDAHIKRLQSGCQRLFFAAPDLDKLTLDVSKIAKVYSLAVLKVIITAGQGGRGYSRLGSSVANVIIQVHEYPKHYHCWASQGVTLGISEQKLGLNPMLAGIKHLNRLEQVLIRHELDHCQEDDLLVLNIRDEIVETSCSNVFWQVNSRWFSPEITSSGVAGLARDHIISSLGYFEFISAGLSALEEASAMFICNSVMGIVPVRLYDNRVLDIEPVLKIMSDF